MPSFFNENFVKIRIITSDFVRPIIWKIGLQRLVRFFFKMTQLGFQILLSLINDLIQILQFLLYMLNIFTIYLFLKLVDLRYNQSLQLIQTTLNLNHHHIVRYIRLNVRVLTQTSHRQLRKTSFYNLPGLEDSLVPWKVVLLRMGMRFKTSLAELLVVITLMGTTDTNYFFVVVLTDVPAEVFLFFYFNHS